MNQISKTFTTTVASQRIKTGNFIRLTYFIFIFRLNGLKVNSIHQLIN